VADRPTSQRSAKLAPRTAGTPAAVAPKVVSEERALALGLPSSESDAGAPPGIAAIQSSSNPLDFGALTAADDAASLAARPADTVIETLLAAAHIGLALLDRDMNYRLWNNCLE